MNVIATVTFATFLYAADLPVVASKLVTGPTSHVELTNTGNQPVTAWSLAVSTRTGEGAFHREVRIAEVYLAEVTRGIPGSTKQLDWLLPGQSRQLPLDPLPSGATVEVLAVVLEDGTGLGDPQTIKTIFARRAAERDAMRQVVDTFNAVLPGKKGLASLEELRERFNASTRPEEPTPHRAAREAVESYIRRFTPETADEIDQSVRKYAAFVERQYEAAVRHSRQKGS